ncbi:unnamed protein product [Scytosiphon promiscuus]
MLTLLFLTITIQFFERLLVKFWKWCWCGSEAIHQAC